MNRYYKTVAPDGSLLCVGTDNNTGIEIAKDEYEMLLQQIITAAEVAETEEETKVYDYEQ